VRERLGECLVQAGLLAEADLLRALEERGRTGERLGAVIARMRLATEEQIARTLSRQLGLPYLDLDEEMPDPAAVELIPRDLAAQHECIAVRRDGDTLTVAMADPLRFSLLHDLESTTRLRIHQAVATPSAILAAMRTSYPDTDGESRPETKRVASTDASADVSRFVDGLLERAVRDTATEIHIDVLAGSVRGRCRIDGVLTEVMRIAASSQQDVFAQLKKMAGMDAGERRQPQDGRLRVAAARGGVDFRVFTIGTALGERAVLTRLTPRTSVPSLEELGMSAVAIDALQKCLRQRRGMLLIVGPRRSGKTTLAAAALQEIAASGRGVVSYEDPVEYVIPGAHQIPIADAGLTMAAALRTEAHDAADVVFVGELGDRETAALAFEIAQWRLVVATLACESRAAALDWIAATPLESAASAGALVGIVTTELVHRLCARCRRDDGSNSGMYSPVGCGECDHTGYRGRIGLFEVVSGAAPTPGTPTLSEDAVSKARSGLTSADELRRVLAQIETARTLCARCGAVVASDYIACPTCGASLGVPCPHCGRTLQADWNFCPYCARSTAEGPHNKGGGRNRIRGPHVSGS